MGKVFNKGLDKDNKEEGLLKRLRDIEDKNEEQLQLIKSVGLQKTKVIIIKTIINLLSTSFTKTLKTLKKSHWDLNTET